MAKHNLRDSENQQLNQVSLLDDILKTYSVV